MAPALVQRSCALRRRRHRRSDGGAGVADSRAVGDAAAGGAGNVRPGRDRQMNGLDIQLPPEHDAEAWRNREWLVTNRLGGYASGTLAGICTRRYHGLFVPNLP